MGFPDGQGEAAVAGRPARAPTHRLGSTLKHVVLVFWITAIAVGMGLLVRYNTTAGPSPNGPLDWPSGTGLTLDWQLPTMVMVAHPRCPCTRASLQEFTRLVSACEGRAAAHVVFFVPEPPGPDWSDSDLLRSARQIPGVQVHADPAGQAAHRLGAKTSGTVFVFAPDGKGLFVGGITASRGHEGDNAGSNAVYQAVMSGKVQYTGTPVFGCLIDDALVESTPIVGASD